MTRFILFSFCILALVGCGDDSSPGTDAGGTDTGGTDAGDTDTGGDSGDVIVCGTGEVSFPSFDRSCATPEDCTIALHQADCCGSMLAMGISASERARFDAAEAVCQPMWPACGCAAQPTMADDGTTDALGSGGTPSVECTAGTCTTTFPEG